MDTEVLIVGAGPTGLAAALILRQYGVNCRIIDKAHAPVNTSNALASQARTLDVYDDIGLLQEVLDRGRKICGVNLYDNKHRLAHISFDGLEANNPFVLSLPQCEIEQLLSDHLESLRCYIERGVELLSLTQDQNRVRATVQTADGEKEISAQWLMGCDGHDSIVREQIGVAFQGKRLDQEFIMADVDLDSPFVEDEVHSFLLPDVPFIIVPVGKEKQRLIAEITHYDKVQYDDHLTPDTFRHLLSRISPHDIALQKVFWMSKFQVSERIAKAYRLGRVFLAGDAAHVHSPVGGQGMNTGIQDAHNLAWKLALVVQKKLDQSILDSYHNERFPVAKEVLSRTTFVTRVISLRFRFVQKVRNFIFGVILKNKKYKKELLTVLGELQVNYRSSHLSWDYAPNLSGPKPGEFANVKLEPRFRKSGFHAFIFTANHAALSEDIEQCELKLLEYFQGCITVHKLQLDDDKPLYDSFVVEEACVYILRPDKYVLCRTTEISDKIVVPLEIC